MRLSRIFTPQVLEANSQLALQGQAGHYLCRVLRRKAGDEIRLFNGEGGEYHARILSTQRDSADLQIESQLPLERESPLFTHLGLVISKGDRMDWAVQKATELGLNQLTPLVSEHCDIKLSPDRAAKKRAHWQQIAISSCEQCGRNRVPKIADIQPLSQWLQDSVVEFGLVFALGGQKLSHWADRSPQQLHLLVGPEGGLSDREVALAAAAGYECASLGPRVLRTETAPIAALALAQQLWGDA